MAKNPSAYLLFLAILVLTTATSSSAQSVPPLPTLPTLGLNLAIGAQAQIAGIVSCTIRGGPPLSGQPVVGAPVNLSCDGGRTSLGLAVTNTAGFYSINLNVVPGILFNTTGCAVFVNLPSNCTIAPPSGALRIPISTVASYPIVISLVPLVIRPIVILLGQVLSLI